MTCKKPCTPGGATTSGSQTVIRCTRCGTILAFVTVDKPKSGKK